MTTLKIMLDNDPRHRFDHDESGYPFGNCIKCGIPRIAELDDPRLGRCRPEWPETWMNIARAIAERSYDPRLKVGAIIVSDDNTQMLSMGYNGNYKGGPHVHDSTEPGQSGFIHAEVNALVKCDFNFHKKKHMYVTHSPCRSCSKLIINAGISRVIYDLEYRDVSGLEMMRSVGIDVMNINDAILTADDT